MLIVLETLRHVLGKLRRKMFVTWNSLRIFRRIVIGFVVRMRTSMSNFPSWSKSIPCVDLTVHVAMDILLDLSSENGNSSSLQSVRAYADSHDIISQNAVMVVE